MSAVLLSLGVFQVGQRGPGRKGLRAESSRLLRKLRLRQGQGCRYRNNFAERLAEIGAESHPHADWPAMVESALAAATVLYPEVPAIFPPMDQAVVDLFNAQPSDLAPPASFTDGMAGVWPKE